MLMVYTLDKELGGASGSTSPVQVLATSTAEEVGAVLRVSIGQPPLY
jgi:hypothetical protein